MVHCPYMTNEPIIITTIINVPVARVYQAHIDSADLVRWQSAGGGWFTSYAQTNPVIGGEFHIGYASPNAAEDFDFAGTYTELVPEQRISYRLADGRTVSVVFQAQGESQTSVTTTFDPETMNTRELQQQGWAAVMDNLVDYVQRAANPTMRQIVRSVILPVPAEQAWHLVLDHENYREWTAAFTQGSDYQGEFVQGGRIRFTAPGGDGIISMVHVYAPSRCIAFRHLGWLQNGIEDYDSPAMQSWKNAREEYLFTPVAGGTRFDLYCDTSEAEHDTMSNMWDKALATLADMAQR